MKFETYDRKYQICFIEKSSFKSFARFLKKYKAYIEEINIAEEYFTLNERGISKAISPSYLVEPHALYRLNYRWIKSLKLLIFNQEHQLAVKDILFKFDINSRDEIMTSNYQEMNRRFNGSTAFDRDFLFNNLDLENLAKFSDVLNFSKSQQATVRKQLFRDIDFLTENDVTNFSVQFIIDKDLTYHFGICDYTD